MRQALVHIVTIVGLLAACVGVPAWLAGVDVVALAQGGTDLVSSATTIQDAPSGSFYVFLNRDLHTDQEVLGYWVDFFEGKDVPLIMEDVSCVTLAGDSAGLEMAQSLASRLPANQMKIRTEDATLALSKAEVGRFDVLVVSDEAAAQANVDALLADERVEVIHR